MERGLLSVDEPSRLLVRYTTILLRTFPRRLDSRYHARRDATGEAYLLLAILAAAAGTFDPDRNLRRNLEFQ